MNLQIFLLAAVLVVVIFIIVRYHPQFIIFFSRIMYGRYHPNYVQTHKNFTGKSPYAYCIKDDFINHISGYFGKSKPTESFKSNLDIEFGSLPFACKYRKLITLKGKPFCANLLRNEFFDLKIFGYREELIGSKIRTNFYFIDKKFFMGEFSLKTPAQERIEELSTVLQKKYLGERKTNSENFIIEGANNVLVLFENTGFHLAIKYFDKDNEDIKPKLDEFWESSVYVAIPEPATEIESDLMERL
jgi:hypothetical protein